MMCTRIVTPVYFVRVLKFVYTSRYDDVYGQNQLNEKAKSLDTVLPIYAIQYSGVKRSTTTITR